MADVCIKQERMDSEAESDYTSNTPDSPTWKMCSEWMDTTKEKHFAENIPTLVIPFGENSKILAQRYGKEDFSIRAKRELVPEKQKDTTYWTKRLKNNASARRSRMKKKIIEKSMESQLQILQRENIELKYELAALKRHFADQLDSKPYEEEAADLSMRTGNGDLSMRTGSASDSSDSSQDGNEYHGENLTSSSNVVPSQVYVSRPYMNERDWYVPFNYSFLPNSVKDDRDISVEDEQEIMNKIPHKFRHKKDLHSAFYS